MFCLFSFEFEQISLNVCSVALKAQHNHILAPAPMAFLVLFRPGGTRMEYIRVVYGCDCNPFCRVQFSAWEAFLFVVKCIHTPYRVLQPTHNVHDREIQVIQRQRRVLFRHSGFEKDRAVWRQTPLMKSQGVKRSPAEL